MKRGIRCPSCEEVFAAEPGRPGAKVRCPVCNTGFVPPEADEPAGPRRVAKPAGPRATKEGEALPLQAEGHRARDRATPKFCPVCRDQLPGGAVICIECGYNTQTGKRLRTTVAALRYRFQPPPGPILRFVLTLALVSPVVPFLLVGARDPRVKVTLLLAAVMWAGLMAVAFGTFVRAVVERDEDGRATLTRGWWALFLPLPSQTLELDRYETLYYGYRAGLLDAGTSGGGWVMLAISMILCGPCFGLMLWVSLWKEIYYLQLGDRDGRRVVVALGGEDAVRAFGDRIREAAPHIRPSRS